MTAEVNEDETEDDGTIRALPSPPRGPQIRTAARVGRPRR